MPSQIDSAAASACSSGREGLLVIPSRWTPASAARALLRRALDVSDEATTCRSRGFRVTDDAVRARLDAIGRSFVEGYRAGLAADSVAHLPPMIDGIDESRRGFAYEGAAMALALRDRLQPARGHRVEALLNGPAAAHQYVVHVGVGWAQARLRRPPGSLPRGLDPLLQWLVVDGHGFHQGFFHWREYVDRRTCRADEDPSIQSVFDQGLGRSLWFVEGADPDRIGRTVAGFPASRRADLWSGVGLACAYAGGADPMEIESLRASAGASWRHLAQGACFAAEARMLAGNQTADCDIACRVLCGLDAGSAALVARRARPALSGDGSAPVSLYLDWRRAVRDALQPWPAAT